MPPAVSPVPGDLHSLALSHTLTTSSQRLHWSRKQRARRSVLITAGLEVLVLMAVAGAVNATLQTVLPWVFSLGQRC